MLRDALGSAPPSPVPRRRYAAGPIALRPPLPAIFGSSRAVERSDLHREGAAIAASVGAGASDIDALPPPSARESGQAPQGDRAAPPLAFAPEVRASRTPGSGVRLSPIPTSSRRWPGGVASLHSVFSPLAGEGARPVRRRASVLPERRLISGKLHAGSGLARLSRRPLGRDGAPPAASATARRPVVMSTCGGYMLPLLGRTVSPPCLTSRLSTRWAGLPLGFATSFFSLVRAPPTLGYRPPAPRPAASFAPQP